MAQIRWTEPALIDLNAIAEHIAIDKPNAAKRFVQNVFAATDRLEQFPNSGRKPPELKKSRYREILVAPCRIFYRSEKENVYILYIMRGEALLRKFLLDARAKETT